VCVRGELDDALASGTRACALARSLGDLELRILTTSYLEQVHYIRGDYTETADLAGENLAALPADWAHRYLGRPAPPSVYDRYYLALSLAHLGRFGEAAERAAEAIALAEATQHAFTLTLAHQADGMIQLLAGDWAAARAPIERWVAVARASNIVITPPTALAALGWCWRGRQLTGAGAPGRGPATSRPRHARYREQPRSPHTTRRAPSWLWAGSTTRRRPPRARRPAPSRCRRASACRRRRAHPARLDPAAAAATSAPRWRWRAAGCGPWSPTAGSASRRPPASRRPRPAGEHPAAAAMYADGRAVGRSGAGRSGAAPDRITGTSPGSTRHWRRSPP
jgi:hypothetical protein